MRVLLLGAGLLAGGQAQALTLFGTHEDVQVLEDVNLRTPEGEALFLGHKTTTSYFIGGLAMSDDGYILGLRSDPDRILDMPEGDTLADFQRKGLLPDPLPPYSVGLPAYVRGFSFWIIAGLLALAYGAFAFSRRMASRSVR